MCKCELQNYTKKNNLDPHIFTIKTEGMAHDLHFKATVAVDGKSFESPAFFKTRKEAEQEATKIALMSLLQSTDIYKKASVLVISDEHPN